MKESLQFMMKKILKIFFAIISLGIIYAVICLGLMLTKINTRPSVLTGYQTILILGSKIDGNNLQHSKPAQMTRNRLDAGIKLAKLNPEAKIIVTGYKASNENVNESAGMAKYLEDNSVSADRIIKEPKARNTYENLRYSSHYFKGKVILVTSDFHLERSLVLAEKQHLIHISGFAAKTTLKNKLEIMSAYFHETLGLGRALIFGH